MDIRDSEGNDGAALERRLTDGLDKNLGGKVTRIERQGRWRPAWFVDMEDVAGPKRIDVRRVDISVRPGSAVRSGMEG